MMMYLRLDSILLLFLLALITAALPQLTVNDDPYPIRCNKPILPIFRKRLNDIDCRSAIAQLPEGKKHHTFHDQGTNDGYLLPVYKLGGGCEVAVKMAHDRHADTWTWLLVARYAQVLRYRCVESNGYGGNAFVGDGLGIEIAIGKPGTLNEEVDPDAEVTS